MTVYAIWMSDANQFCFSLNGIEMNSINFGYFQHWPIVVSTPSGGIAESTVWGEDVCWQCKTFAENYRGRLQDEVYLVHFAYEQLGYRFTTQVNYYMNVGHCWCHRLGEGLCRQCKTLQKIIEQDTKMKYKVHTLHMSRAAKCLHKWTILHDYRCITCSEQVPDLYTFLSDNLKHEPTFVPAPLQWEWM